MPTAPQHPPLHDTVRAVTDRVRALSAATRAAYVQRIDAAARDDSVERAHLGCTNLAHGYAAAPKGDKIWLRQQRAPNIAIVPSYNDMLSAHQPLAAYPDWIKQAARDVGATAQFAGGVPAMCDGVTQGQAGMELSLFSRDVIAMATAVALSHNMFDATLCLGVCDKIVPGLLIGALSFGHLPTIFVPGGPMGTCHFYGTANSNQMLMEIMGLHLPGTAFVSPGTALREALTRASAQRVVQLTRHSAQYTPVGHVVDERAVVNGIVGLLATGGSTNHTLHLVAIARAAGIVINWDDFDALSNVVPLLARVYPNGSADVNAFQAAGGVALVIRELLSVGLLHADVRTVAGPEGLWHYTQQPVLHNGTLTWGDAPAHSGDASIIATAQAPFSPDGGLRLLQGNLGRAVIKGSAVKPAHSVVEAPALVLRSLNP